MKALFFFALAAFVVYVYSDNPLTPKCPEEMDEIKMVVHPCNCSTYYVCLTDPPIPMSCPSGLQFDEKNQICDFKWRVKCKPNALCPKTASTLELESL